MVEIDEKTKEKVQMIADYLFRSDYPRTAVTKVFEKFGTEKSTADALGILSTGKMIRLDNSIGDHVTLLSIQTLDQNGNDIRHEMCDTYEDSDTFGTWHYDSKTSNICLADHPFNPNRCPECCSEKGNWICVSHNQSALFCQKCRDITAQYKQKIKEMGMDVDEFIKILMDEHHKSLLKRKNLPMFSPYEKRFNSKESPMMSLLEDLGVDFSKKEHTSYKFKSAGFMDLTVETWIEGEEMKVSVCHYGEQNGDLMRDPEIVYALGIESKVEVPLSYRNDYTGTEQEVYPVINDTVMISDGTLHEIKDFTKIWVKNIKQQGHKLSG